MCGIFVFSDFAQKMWKKIRFKFENRKIFYKGFPCKKNSMEFYINEPKKIKMGRNNKYKKEKKKKKC